MVGCLGLRRETNCLHVLDEGVGIAARQDVERGRGGAGFEEMGSSTLSTVTLRCSRYLNLVTEMCSSRVVTGGNMG